MSKTNGELLKKSQDKDNQLNEAVKKESDLSKRLGDFDLDLKQKTQLIESLREELKTINESYRSALNEIE